MGNYTLFIMIGLVLVMMWFTSRGQRKQQQERLEMLNQMKPGDKVVTIGGLYGVIDSFDTTDNTVTLDIDGIYLVFERSAIKTVVKSSASAVVADGEEEQAEDSIIEE